MTDPVRWFDYHSTCGVLGCGKFAAGVLRGPGNESYGSYCKKHGEARLKKAEQERKRAEREMMKTLNP